MPIYPKPRSVEIPETVLCRRCFQWLPPALFYQDQSRAPWTRGRYSAACKSCTKLERREVYHRDPVAAAAAHKRRRHRREARTPTETARAVLERLRKRQADPLKFARQRIKRAFPKPRMTFAELVAMQRAARAHRSTGRSNRTEPYDPHRAAQRAAQVRAARAEAQKHAERAQAAERATEAAAVARVMRGRSADRMTPEECMAALLELRAARG